MDRLITALRSGEKSVNVTGLRGGAVAWAIARSTAATNRPSLCVVPTERQAGLLEQDLALFTELPVLLYPGYDIPPYTPLSPDPRTVANRIAVLYETLTAEKPHILISSCEALLRRVIPKNILSDLAELVIRGEETNRDKLIQRLTDAGYESMALVQSAGEFSVRGGIVDVFPPGFPNPVRLDFFGDTVEAIRSFDPITQRSIEDLSEIVFLPAADIIFPAQNSGRMLELTDRITARGTALGWQADELARLLEQIGSRRRFPGIEFFLPLFYSTTATPLDYLPEKSEVFIIDPPEISRSVNLIWERIAANHAEITAAADPALPPEVPFLTAEELNRALTAFIHVQLLDYPEATTSAFNFSCGNHKLINQEISLQRTKHGLLTPLAGYILSWLEQGDLVLFACNSARHAGHLAEILNRHGIEVSIKEHPVRPAELSGNTVFLYDHPLSQGFDLAPDKAAAPSLHVLSESELFGERRLGVGKKGRGKSRAPRPAGEPFSFDELRHGDIVVHNMHGLGTYEGLVNLDLGGTANDYLQISYQGNDRLYVPADRINCVNKYKGLTDRKPKIDKLGGKSWFATKKKVKDAVWKVAQDLLQLYARRQLRKGHAFARPGSLFQELEESFPFDETPDQDKAINAVLADMTSDQPMDRLICGDVGYGKTEIAVRAAFKAVEDGFQVAALVPTTVLAEQHAATFRERFTGFPVEVECLNRFRSPAQQRRILAKLQTGAVDVIIGTHRLLSRDVKFKRLGLLIVDEEHRFGVSHKEKIKRLRAEVDILTLTATPIPRTLQMSLLGIRDLSVISTPPARRRSIKTFVARNDDLVIKEAVIRELQRRGQVFIVHNRVQSIRQMAAKVQKLAPTARVAVAHGQMPGRNLEKIMVDFVKKELDVLVCTTIIESGLDIPNANTIIINRADRLGLAEIYQLRGRVGRSSEQSYAYLLVPSLDGLTKDAKDRLRALMDCGELGGGFKLAMSDLQIRGGGNLLGVSQSGHIAAVGYDLYLDLLQKTVADLQQQSDRREETVEVEPEINLHISAYIPAHYIPDTDQRYIAYRRISSLATHEEIIDLRDELKDRYGAPPPETDSLFEIITLKIGMRCLKIAKLEQGKEALVFTFNEQPSLNPEKLLQFIAKTKNRARFTPEARLIVPVPPAVLAAPAPLLETAANVLRDLL